MRGCCRGLTGGQSVRAPNRAELVPGSTFEHARVFLRGMAVNHAARSLHTPQRNVTRITAQVLY